MITIVEPKESIEKLWGKQKVHEDATYRLMQYVLRVDHGGKVLLHNVVTGRLVVLDQAETETVDKIPMKYEPTMEQLIVEHYLVPEGNDEHQQVMNLREILRKLDAAQKEEGIVHYTILPTTACNAHCFYCYEHGLKPEIMSRETADDVVKFIKQHCRGKKIWIRWFGGEPTLEVHLIDQICEGLHSNSVSFTSRMTTNGYLLDKELIAKMKAFWNLDQVMISLDGSEENYNQTKAFAGVHDNPYQRVLQNVGLLLDEGVQVNLRMNFDKRNYLDFNNLLEDIERQFGNNPLLQIRPHQINPKEKDIGTKAFREYEEWCSEKIVALNDLSRNKGLFHKMYPLPCLEYKDCLAASDNAVVILPDGSLVSCPDLLGSDQIKGNIWLGITEREKVASWKQLADYKRCKNCLFFPKCVIASNCKGGNFCIFRNEYLKQYRNTAIRHLLHSVSQTQYV